MEEAVVDLIRQDYLISVEYALFMRKRRSGVYCIPTVANSMEWAGVMFIRVGVFQGAIFRFRVYLPDDENGVPSFRFENDVYHPAVDRKTGELDTSLLYSQCSADKLHVYHVINFAQEIFDHSALRFKNCISGEISRQLQEQPEEFFAKAKNCVFQSREAIFDLLSSEDEHSIRSLYALEPSNPRTVEAIYFQLQPVYTLRQDSGNFVQQAATSLKSVRQ
ncbi:Protein crossbronx [Trichinella pseudospiralis]|uniref:Protein crossbronx n=2 Tax=Trichinella pseudospiralis TaxID=6337 RepID=A0A0V1HNR1_TRIPS